MNGGAQQPFGRAELWLEQHYARVGVRYLYEIMAGSLAWAMFLFVLGVGGLTLYLGGTTGDFWHLLAVAEGLSLVFGPAGLWLWTRRSPATKAWLQGDHSPQAARRAWSDTVRAPIRLPMTVYSVAFPAQVFFAFYAAPVLDRGLASVPVIFLAAAQLTVIGALGIAAFVGQLVVRPVLREIARHLPADAEFEGARSGLAQQIMLRFAVLGLIMTLAGGVVAVISDDPDTRFTLGFTLGPAALLLLGALTFPLTALSLVSPVNALIDATRRAREGDLTAQVPVVTSDELGELSHSFNTMIADLRRATEELRESRARIVAAADAGRRRVERDLHDGAQQHLVLLNLQFGMIERAVGGDPAGETAVAQAKETLTRALDELRDLAHGIYPAVLESDGLPSALADAARRAAIPTTVEANGTGRLPGEIEAAVYFCCLEALQNAAKHGGATARATVRLAAREQALEFEVADDGPGFEVNGTPGGGLQNMADRIGALGGTLAIESAPGAGTTVRGRVPV